MAIKHHIPGGKERFGYRLRALDLRNLRSIRDKADNVALGRKVIAERGANRPGREDAARRRAS